MVINKNWTYMVLCIKKVPFRLLKPHQYAYLINFCRFCNTLKVLLHHISPILMLDSGCKSYPPKTVN